MTLPISFENRLRPLPSVPCKAVIYVEISLDDHKVLFEGENLNHVLNERLAGSRMTQ